LLAFSEADFLLTPASYRGQIFNEAISRMATRPKAILNNKQYRQIEMIDEQLQCADEAREILTGQSRGEQFDPDRWKFTRSGLTGEKLRTEKFSVKERQPSLWMLPKRRTKQNRDK